MTTFDIKVWFDTICPWCYIGDKILREAISLYQKTYPGGSTDTFKFTFLPFYLDPTLPHVGIPISDRIGQKNGQERVNAIQTRLQRVGRAHGINFTFQGKIGNTQLSHMLIHYVGAKRPDDQRALIDLIFQSLFERDMDIASPVDLSRAALTIGLSEDEATAALESEEGRHRVDLMVSEARVKGVSAVPTVEINGTRIEGAEDASVFYEAMVNAKNSIA